MRSNATSVEAYLAELPAERLQAIAALRQVIVSNLPQGYVESIGFGMIVYVVPLSVYPDTYNGQPLMYAALASQVNHFAVHLTGIYQSDERRASFMEAYASTGKRCDVGKSCVRFKKLEDVPFELIGHAIASVPMDEFVKAAKAVRNRS